MDTLEEDVDPGEFPRTQCGCGMEVIFTPDGWQHDCAPWFFGSDHDPDVNPAAQAEALRYVVDHCRHMLDEEAEDPRCADCGIQLVYDVDANPPGWVPAAGAIPWRDK